MNKFICVLLLAVTACTTAIIRPTAMRSSAPTRSPAAVARTDHYANSLTSLDQFKSFAIAGDGIVRGGLATKFLVDWRERAEPQIYFFNSNYKEGTESPSYVHFHYDFALYTLGYNGTDQQFNRNYFEPDFSKRQFSPGTLQLYTLQTAKGTKTVLGIQFYPGDLIKEEGILKIALLVQKRLQNLGVPLAVISYGNQQTFSKIGPDLEKAGIQAMRVQEILGSITYIPMNHGEAWGYLRVFPKDQENLTPSDIPVFKDLPLELSVVAGVISVALQDPGSHINLKSKERGTPNMITRDPKEIEKLRAFEAKNIPVHLVVGPETFTVTKTTDAKVKQQLKKQQGQKWEKIDPPLAAEVTSFEAMCPNHPSDCLEASRKFGGKASKLGLLASSQVAGIGSEAQKIAGYRITSYGFGVPLTTYNEFVAANPELQRKIKTLVLLEKSEAPPSPQQRTKMAEEIRKAFYTAKFPAKLLKPIQKQLEDLEKQVEGDESQIKLKKVKVRSSANVEDLQGFNGAGLHDSFGAKLKEESSPDQVCRKVKAEENEGDGVETKEDMDPPSLACALKGVYASLWNKRAIEERNFRKFDHEFAAMGIAVVPSYNFLAKLKDKNAPDNGMEESANSVMVTRVLNTTGVYGYTLSTQVAPNLVTNPSPQTQAEVLVASFLPGENINFTVTQMAKPTRTSPARSSTILNDQQLQKVIGVVQKVEEAYCYANRNYYQGECSFVTWDPQKPRALDMEFKYLGKGDRMRILLKQMREYGGN